MSVYAKWILPWLLDLSMRQRRLLPYRHRTISMARGTVLEIGIGSGRNLPFYGRDVDALYGIDPSPELLKMAGEKVREASCPVLLVRASAEGLPIKDRSVDTVVIAWSLCTIPDPVRALQEMRRVLRPEGKFLFVEHGLAPEPRIQRWQHRLTPCWKRIGGGCHLNRKMDDLIRAAGFRILHIETGYMEGPKPMTFMYEGTACR